MINQPRPIIATTRRGNANTNTNTNSTNSARPVHAAGYHKEADTSSVSHHHHAARRASDHQHAAADGEANASAAAAPNGRRAPSSTNRAAAGAGHVDPYAVPRHNGPVTASRRGSLRSASGAVVSATPPESHSTAVNVSFAADPSLNLTLSQGDYKLLTLSLAQKPNVTSLSLHGNILSDAAVLALCGEISSVHCRLTSLSLAMCGLGNDNAVRVVEAAIAGVHNRRTTRANPKGPPSVLRAEDRRTPRDRHPNYLRLSSTSGGGGSYSRANSSVGGGHVGFSRQQSAYAPLPSNSQQQQPFTGRQRSHSAASDADRFRVRSQSAVSRTASSTAAGRSEAAYSRCVSGGGNGNGNTNPLALAGLRVLDLSLNHITNAGAVAMAEVFNKAALAADLTAAADSGAGTLTLAFSTSSVGRGRSYSAAAYSRMGSAVPSATASASGSVAYHSPSLSERRVGFSPSRVGGVNGSRHNTSAASAVSSAFGEGAGGEGLHTLILRGNRIGASGAQQLLRATSDLRVLDLRYCGMDFAAEEAAEDEAKALAEEEKAREREREREREKDGEGTGNNNKSRTSSIAPQQQQQQPPPNNKNGFAALLQGIADARTVQRLLLDGNAVTQRQRGAIARLLSITAAGSLRSEGITAVLDLVNDEEEEEEEKGKHDDGDAGEEPVDAEAEAAEQRRNRSGRSLMALRHYVAARRPPPGQLYPPAVVEAAAAIAGPTLYVRGVLRNGDARVQVYNCDGEAVGATTLAEEAAREQQRSEGGPVDNYRPLCTLNAPPRGGAGSRSRRAASGNRYGSSNTVSSSQQRTSVGDRRRGASSSANRSRSGIIPPVAADGSVAPLRRSSSVANEQHTVSGLAPTPHALHRFEGVAVAESVAARCRQSLTPLSMCISAGGGGGGANGDGFAGHHETDGDANNVNGNGNGFGGSVWADGGSNALTSQRQLLVDGGGSVAGVPTVSRRGLMVEGGWERPVCGPCPTVNASRLARALASDRSASRGPSPARVSRQGSGIVGTGGNGNGNGSNGGESPASVVLSLGNASASTTATGALRTSRDVRT